MNAPAHFKQQLAAELHAHAATLSAPRGHRALFRLPAPRRALPLAMGVAAAAAVTAIALPLASGAHPAQRAAAPHSAASSGGLNIVNADYTVQSKAGGLVSVQLFDLKGVPGLQAALDKAGIPAKVLAPSASCHAPTPPGDSPHGSLLKAVPPSGFHSDGARDINPGAIVAGDHLLFVPASKNGPVTSLAITLVRQLPSCIAP
ncbi:hypothetical protein POF50_026230 [Streptomyces sp. SL13]|uniref:Uncharacterized protein n=1 Tax=Streptantibioticus silvisoli TaxID=2705255 RepID=A0AA90H2D3_9ACTN|nr:hypothetical protein [Streptantibioticus silvisoli]MDI5972798.1 hypothetical protein [Streptantibioticus silvisoli]